MIPTAFFIVKYSQPLVVGINGWIDLQSRDNNNNDVVVDAEVISKEDA